MLVGLATFASALSCFCFCSSVESVLLGDSPCVVCAAGDSEVLDREIVPSGEVTESGFVCCTVELGSCCGRSGALISASRVERKSSVALRNSRRPRPKFLASSGNFEGPNTKSATTKIAPISHIPSPNTCAVWLAFFLESIVR